MSFPGRHICSRVCGDLGQLWVDCVCRYRGWSCPEPSRLAVSCCRISEEEVEKEEEFVAL